MIMADMNSGQVTRTTVCTYLSEFYIVSLNEYATQFLVPRVHPVILIKYASQVMTLFRRLPFFA